MTPETQYQNQNSQIIRAETGFQKVFGSSPGAIAITPGRINIIGDHTDYNGGLALPAAIDRWVCAAVRIRSQPGIRAFSESTGEIMEWAPGDAQPDQVWMRFVQGAYEIWNRKHEGASGCEVYLWGNIPQGAGLSSSAAVSVSLLNGMYAASGSSITPLELCTQAQQIEHEFIGIETGLLDQMAVVFGKSDRLLEIDFRDLKIRDFVLPNLATKWVVIDSGVHRELAGSGYQKRVEETSRGLIKIQEKHPEVHHFRDLKLTHLESELASEFPLLHKRLHHYVTENERVRKFLKDIAKGDVEAAGETLNLGHYSLRDDYHSSHPALDWLQTHAIGLKGCMGSRIMGGGFGGCLINMVQADQADEFMEILLEKYRVEMGEKGRGFVFEGVDGAGVYAL